MERIMKLKEIYKKDFKGADHVIKIKDLPSNLLPDDEIEIISEEAYFSENNSYDAYTSLIISRRVEETDEEFEERKKISEETKARSKEMRRQQYLKLKEEFEKE